MDYDSVIEGSILLILLALSAFFSSAETALTTVNRLTLRSLKEAGSKQAEITLKLLDSPSKMLSTILVANNIVNISASSLATTLTLRLFGSKMVAVATGLLTFLILIFGEITPKTLASLYNEKMSLMYAPIIMSLGKILTPIIFIVDKFANGILRLLHVDAASVRRSMTEKEFRAVLDVGHEDGVLETEERQMINNVVDFGDSLARDIMVPRIEMTSVSADATYEELRDLFIEQKFTRIPVYENTNDNIIGILNMKDILFYEHTDSFQIRKLMREANFTFEYKKTSELLNEMREASISMILVLDEYGATVGLITLEDLLEEIVGEIRDEFDDDEQNLIVKRKEREYLLDGSLKLDDINDALSLSLFSEEYDSIGGLFLEHLGRLPKTGESVTLEDNTVLKVLEMEKNRIEQILMTLPETEAENTEES